MVMKAAKGIDKRIAHQRSSLRQTLLEDEPVFIEVDLDGKIKLPVVDLGGGGARVLCSKCRSFFEDCYIGQFLGKCVLMLGGGIIPEFEAVIRWKNWPCIGVEFVDLPDIRRSDIFRFLFRVERIKTKRLNMEQERRSDT
jgi:hypothetical protein